MGNGLIISQKKGCFRQGRNKLYDTYQKRWLKTGLWVQEVLDTERMFVYINVNN